MASYLMPSWDAGTMKLENKKKDYGAKKMLRKFAVKQWSGVDFNVFLNNSSDF